MSGGAGRSSTADLRSRKSHRRLPSRLLSPPLCTPPSHCWKSLRGDKKMHGVRPGPLGIQNRNPSHARTTQIAPRNICHQLLSADEGSGSIGSHSTAQWNQEQNLLLLPSAQARCCRQGHCPVVFLFLGVSCHGPLRRILCVSARHCQADWNTQSAGGRPPAASSLLSLLPHRWGYCPTQLIPFPSLTVSLPATSLF